MFTFETISKCINTQGSYWCHCPDYFRGNNNDMAKVGMHTGYFGGILSPTDYNRRVNQNLMSCKLQTTCSSQGFGMNTKSKDHLHNSASAKRGELKFRGLMHVICKQHMLGVQLMVKNVLH